MTDNNKIITLYDVELIKSVFQSIYTLALTYINTCMI